MPRTPGVRYFASRGGYYCQFHGKQHPLAKGPKDEPTGPTYHAALKAFADLMAMGKAEERKDDNTLRVVCEKYFQHADHLAGSTVECRQKHLRLFVEALGDLAVRDLTHLKVEDFIADMRRPRTQVRRSKRGAAFHRVYSWCEATVAAFLVTANAVMNWAVETKLITANPLRGLRSRQIRSRSRDCLITPEQHAALLGAARTRAMRNILAALEDTGARPGELLAATAADWDDGLGAICYFGDDRRREDEFRHKTAGGNKDRYVRFTGEALAMVRELVAARVGPKSLLFPNSRGRRYGRNSFCYCFAVVAENAGHPDLTAYAYRHRFATEWLLAGKPIEVLAALLGNSPRTILKHYAHLFARQDDIRRHLEEFHASERT